MTRSLTGAEILMECLLEQGVDTVFGYPGGQVLPIYDALYRYRNRIAHYLTAHEQYAAHAADGYARSTGKTGVCIATSGPGATNLVTGIAAAYMDSSPVIAITGNVPVPLLGKDSFQEVDITGVTMPITKHNYIVKDIRRLADTVREAFAIAQSGRPGPVLIDIPKDVTTQTYAFTQKPPAARPEPALFSSGALQSCVSALQNAKQPLVLAGGGVVLANAAPELDLFLQRLDAPVCVSVMGIGSVPASSPRFTGMIGMHGTAASNILSSECDLLIAVGSRFSDRVVSNARRFAANAQVIHIDIDAAEINKNIQVHHKLIGNAKEALTRLCHCLPQQRHTQWMKRAAMLKAERSPEHPSVGHELRPRYIFQCISRLAPDGTIFVTEVGQHQMWACQYLPVERPRSFITSGGLGAMGFGLGASVGAAAAHPGVPILNISGDGSFRMSCIELSTAVAYTLPIITVLFNNRTLGMVWQWQTMFHNGVHAYTSLADKPVDYVKLAEAYGAAAFRVACENELDAALKTAFARKGPAVIDCEVNAEENVFPMVAPGSDIDQPLYG